MRLLFLLFFCAPGRGSLMDAKQFGARVKELRERAGLNQQGLAERIGMTVRTVSRLETGTQEATWPVVLALAEAFGVDCRAFQEPPAERHQPKRGRPPKAAAESEGPKPMKGRGRPRKGE
jgi:transcriptional regulator with XRE-family HTH domain